MSKLSVMLLIMALICTAFAQMNLVSEDEDLVLDDDDLEDDTLEEDSSEEDQNFRAPMSYGFIALLYNSRSPNRTCVGALITQWWVLDHCEDFPGSEYEYFKLGAISTDEQNAVDYKIEETVRHYGYKILDMKSSKFDTQMMYATEHALFLHRSATEIPLIPDKSWTVKLSDKPITPKKPHVLYLRENKVVKPKLVRKSADDCNKHFEIYFDSGQQPLLDSKTHICLNSATIKHAQCCNSQAFVISDSLLLGIMAWSTGCSKEFGLDPWVFTNLAYYMSWIQDHSNIKEFLAGHPDIDENNN